tara:strand:- start:67613 stop:67783 length:171 start_codon:yes stop_codon:yes gene_type:complete
MFKLFKKKSKVDLLNANYKKLLNQAYVLSKTNRKESDTKYAEADGVLQEIEALKKK